MAAKPPTKRRGGRTKQPAPVGKRLGQLTVLRELPERRQGRQLVRFVEVECDCGRIQPTALAPLTSGRKLWCGWCGRRRRAVKPGERFAMLVVLKELEGQARWGQLQRRGLVRCDCGEEKELPLNPILNGTTRSCGCLQGRKRFPPPVGDKFGWLTVVDEVAEKRNASGLVMRCVRARCDCGNVVTVSLHGLGDQSSCGCKTPALRRARIIPGAAGRKRTIEKYQWSAHRRGLEWSLTDEEFFELVAQPCTYCGDFQSNRSSDWTGEGGYLYTGLDRIDSDHGYSRENVTPCCGFCNRAKWNSKPEKFYAWIDRIIEHKLREQLRSDASLALAKPS